MDGGRQARWQMCAGQPDPAGREISRRPGRSKFQICLRIAWWSYSSCAPQTTKFLNELCHDYSDTSWLCYLLSFDNSHENCRFNRSGQTPLQGLTMKRAAFSEIQRQNDLQVVQDKDGQTYAQGVRLQTEKVTQQHFLSYWIGLHFGCILWQFSCFLSILPKVERASRRLQAFEAINLCFDLLGWSKILDHRALAPL